MQRAPYTRLEQLVRDRGMSVPEFQREFRRQALRLGENLSVSRSQAIRWLSGKGSPRLAAQKVLEEWTGESVQRLFGSPMAPVPSARGVESQWMAGLERVVSAARESVAHAMAAAAALDPSALEHLRAAADDCARAYYVKSALEMLTDLVSLRDTVYAVLDRTRKPAQQAELYLIACQVCGLLSSVSWDLGLQNAAEGQARAAHTYGSLIDHLSVQAWARALQSTVAFWAGNTGRAIDLAADGLANAPAGTARVRLHSVHARALAMTGATENVRSELEQAADELGRAGDDEFLDRVGGELAFDVARRGLCAGAAYVRLGDGLQAEREAQNAVDLFAAVPADRRWTGGALSAQVDLGSARTLRGDLAGAREALTSVLNLAPGQCTEAIAQRLDALGDVLGSASRYRTAVEARNLRSEIQEFTTATASGRAALRALAPPM